MLVIGDQVVHPTIPGVAAVLGMDEQFLTLKYGPKDIRKLSQRHPVTALVRKATEDEVEASQPYVMWTDPDTGAPTRFAKKFLQVIDYLGVGRENAITTSEMLELMGEPDTDGHRRHLRGALDYYIGRHSLLVCSSPEGYFIALTDREVEDAVREKMKKADNLQSSAHRLTLLDVAASKQEFARLRINKLTQ